MEHTFNIIVRSENHLTNFLKRYNSINNTCFELDEIIYDEVTFARLKTNKDSPDEIFKLGIEYGRQTTLLRINNQDA